MFKRMLLCLAMLGLAGCTSNNHTLNSGVALILIMIVGIGFIVAIAAAFAAIFIRGSSERRVVAALVALVAVFVGVFFTLVLVA